MHPMRQCTNCLLPRHEPCERSDCGINEPVAFSTHDRPVLDHGYVRYIDSCGSDQAIIEAARMSTNKGFEGWDKDFKLLRFLWQNGHHTPFEMADLTIEVKAPLFVFREWHRHRTQSYNEMSARYIPLPDENYIPSAADIVARSAIAAFSSNKQAQASKEISPTNAEEWLAWLRRNQAEAQRIYETGLNLGVPKELARLSVSVARYSRMRAKANLRNWLHFCQLRQAPNAQCEIRQYANAVGELLALRFPKTYALFKGEDNGATDSNRSKN